MQLQAARACSILDVALAIAHLSGTGRPTPPDPSLWAFRCQLVINNRLMDGYDCSVISRLPCIQTAVVLLQAIGAIIAALSTSIPTIIRHI